MAASTYAARLREALDRDGWSQLRLVRELAERTGNAVDSERSAVRGYLKRNMPRPDRARMIAEITGVPELSQVEDPRRSHSARIEDHLEVIADDIVDVLANQKRATQSLLDEMRAIHEKLDILLGDAHTQPRQRRER